jgi:hypothetical protein
MRSLFFIVVLSGIVSLGITAPAAAQCGGDPGCSMVITSAVPGEIAIGETFTIDFAVPVASYVLLFGSLGSGPTSTPFGDLCLDFPVFAMYGFTLPNEALTVPCQVPCDPTVVGVKTYLQFVGLPLSDPTSSCRSNMTCIEITDADCADEGCTPGYWKQEHHHDSWPLPYTPGSPFSTWFDDAFTGLTLQDVVAKEDTPIDALEILGAHTVAALLNAASTVNYPMSVQEVIDAFNAAYLAGTDEAYLAQKDLFEAFNEAGCPLN